MFHNDAYSQFENNPDETMDNILNAMDGVPEDRHHYGVGNHANPMIPKKPRHANEDVVYMLSGNTLTEMSLDNPDTEKFMKVNPEYYQGMLDVMRYKLNELQNKLNKLKNV